MTSALSWSRRRGHVEVQSALCAALRSPLSARDAASATFSLALAMADGAGAAVQGVFARPPMFVLLGVLEKLPADARMRCAEVNRA